MNAPLPAAEPAPDHRPRRTGPELVGLVLGPLLFALIAFGPTIPALDGAPQRALGILAWCATWWLTTPVALPVTSLLGLALLPILGVLDKTRAMALFGNQSVFFVVAAFIVAAVAVRTGLSSRVALWSLHKAGHSEDRLAAGTLLVAAGLTAVIISHAVAALLLPIVIEIIRASNLGPGSRFARRLLLSMAWGTICGSNFTLLSSARASLATGMYAAWAEQHGLPGAAIGFLEYSAASLLPSLASLALAYVALRWFHPPEGVSLDAAKRRLHERAQGLGRVSRDERATALVIGGMVVALVLYGNELGLGTIALASAATLFVSRAASWEDAENRVNWGVALLYGGAIAVAAAIEETGALGVLVELLPVASIPVWGLVSLCAGLTVLITAFVSNAAAIALLLPLCLTVAEQVGINARAMAVLLPVAAGLDFSLPVSTPAMAMVFGTGYLRTQDSVVPGVLVSIVGTALTVLITALVWPLLGLSVTNG